MLIYTTLSKRLRIIKDIEKNSRFFIFCLTFKIAVYYIWITSISLLHNIYMSSANQALHVFEKKTFNIKREYAERMRKLIPSRKQADFVNKAISEKLEEEER